MATHIQDSSSHSGTLRAMNAGTDRTDTVGGGSAGVSAAVAAATMGARVVLVERYGFLGGAATASSVMTYDGFLYRRQKPEFAVGGIGKAFLAKLAIFGPPPTPLLSGNGNWIIPFNTEAAKLALDALLLDAGVTGMLHALVTDVRVVDAAIRSIVASDHAGSIEIKARQFVDASGEADLASMAGVPLAFADESRFAASLCARIGGIPEQVPLDRERLAAAAALANAGDIPVRVRDSGGFTTRIPGSADHWWMGVDVLTDGLTSSSLTQAEQHSRLAIWAFVAALRQQPGCQNATLVSTGPQLGVRETRHPVARYMLTEADAKAGKRSATGIARAAWNIERHDIPGKPVTQPLGGDDFFDIPLESLQAERIGNLWLAGRTVGADRTAYSALRVMGTAFATGHAAGAAAALALREKPDPQRLRVMLRSQGAIV